MKKFITKEVWFAHLRPAMEEVHDRYGITHCAWGSDHEIVFLDIDAELSQHAVNVIDGFWHILTWEDSLEILQHRAQIFWLSIHLFDSEPDTMPPNHHKVAELYNNLGYRQNPKAVAEVYGFDVTDVLLVAPDDMPCPVGWTEQPE